jgi:hypothetical protein
VRLLYVLREKATERQVREYVAQMHALVACGFLYHCMLCLCTNCHHALLSNAVVVVLRVLC